MKVLVTGGAGYLGSVLVGKLLEQGHEVKVLDALMFGSDSLLSFIYNKNFFLFKGDVRNKTTVKNALKEIDAVFHLAALVGEPACSVDQDLTRQINYEATSFIAQEAYEQGVKRFIFTSTCSNYGVSDPKTSATEDSPLNPLSSYAETKINAEKKILEVADNKFAVTVLRLATIFGLSPKMRFNLLINEMVREAYINKKILLYKEDSWRPYTHVEDAADALITVFNSDLNLINKQIFNVGTENYQKKELVKLVKKYVPDLVVDNQGGLPDNRDYRVSFDKIKEVLGFTPKRKVKDGIDELFNAVKNNYFANLYEDRFVSWINKDVLDNL